MDLQVKYKDNILIRKDEIGKSRQVGYEVSHSKTYGKPCYDSLKQSAKQGLFLWVVISQWKMPVATERCRPTDDFVRMNKLNAYDQNVKQAFSTTSGASGRRTISPGSASRAPWTYASRSPTRTSFMASPSGNALQQY